jgi:ferredoxin-NADP reductase
MAIEPINILQDLARSIEQIGVRLSLKKEGGVDYTADRYKEYNKKIVESLHPELMQLQVVELIDETPTTRTLRLERTDGALPPFRAGQYVNLFVDCRKVRTSRPYSISSAPGADYLDLTVDLKSSGFISPYLVKKVKVGDKLQSTGPAGQFYFEPLLDRGGLVFLAGGSGITPFMSILRQHKALGWPIKIDLIYGCRKANAVIFSGELKKLAKESKMFDYTVVLSEAPANYKGERGFITADLIKKQVGDLAEKTVMICGPGAMYDFTMTELKKLNVPRHKIRRELFGLPDDVTAQPGWPKAIKARKKFKVTIEGKGEIKASATEPLLNSLEREGIVVPALCRSGECSNCRIRLVEGEVYMPPDVGLRESDRKRGYIHSCASYPISDLVIRL